MTADADEFHRLKLMLEGASAVHLCCANLRTAVEALRIAERVVRPEFLEQSIRTFDSFDDSVIHGRDLRDALTDPRPA